MKPIYYFFGINKGKNQFHINDPIMLREGTIYEFYSQESQSVFEFKYKLLENILKIFTVLRNKGFGYSKKKSRIEKFLSYGRLLIPEIQKNETTVFFLNDENCILFNVNKKLEKRKEIKENIWKWIKNLNVCTKKEFEKCTKSFNFVNHNEHDSDNCTFSSGIKLSVAVHYSLFFCLYGDNYYELKYKANKLWIKHRQKKSEIFLR